MSQQKVAIVVPCHKPVLTGFELISYNRLWMMFPDHPIILMAPTHLDVACYRNGHHKLPVEFFNFRTVRDYSQLLLSVEFYERFADFEYILIHQLDCYLFQNNLTDWCNKGFDYIGAPLFEGFEPVCPRGKLWMVGNGGFSLRKIQSAIRVLRSTMRYQTPCQFLKATPKPSSMLQRVLRLLKSVTKITSFHNNIRWATLSNFNEDVFWSSEARIFAPEFRVAPMEEALKFSFDYAPAYCHELNKGKLPFGCHAWQKYDLAFWKQYIPEAINL